MQDVLLRKLGPPGFGRGSEWIVFRRERPRLVAESDETGREALRQAVRRRETEFLDGNK
jgi:hypothetical protein